MVGYRWTPEQEKYLIENYGKIPVDAIAKKVGKSEGAVEGKAYRLGLKKKVYYPPHIKKVINSGSNLIEEIDKVDQEIRRLLHVLSCKFDALAKEVEKKIKPIEEIGIRVVSVEVKHDPEDPTYKSILITINSDRLIELSKLSGKKGLDKWYDEYKRVLQAAHDWVDEHMPAYSKHIAFYARE